MKKITFETPTLYYDERGKIILQELYEVLAGKIEKKKNGKKQK